MDECGKAARPTPRYTIEEWQEELISGIAAWRMARAAVAQERREWWLALEARNQIALAKLDEEIAHYRALGPNYDLMVALLSWRKHYLEMGEPFTASADCG